VEVLGRKAELETAADAEQQARDEAQRQKEAHATALRERWDQSKAEIAAAIAAVNGEIVAAGLQFSGAEKPRDTESPRLSQFVISLAQEGQIKDRQLVFNVSGLGLVQSVTLIPHTGPKIADFKITDADQAKYEAVLAEFLDICFAAAKTK
jgi:hypothetical protein